MMFSICAAPTSISECDHKGVLEHVVVEVAVGGKSHDSTPTDGQRVEGLSGCVFPHLHNKQKKKFKCDFITFVQVLSRAHVPAHPRLLSDWTGSRCRILYRLWRPLVLHL